jgi:hypothetical protein
MTDKPKWIDLFGIDPNYLEGVPEEPTLTASEVKVLTETASKVAYALGRKDAGEEIAAEFEYLGVILGSYVAKKVRSMSALPSGATSDATSGVPEATEMGSESQAASNRLPQEPCGHPTCPCAEGNTPCPDCGLTDDHKGGCPQTGEAPQPGAPG